MFIGKRQLGTRAEEFLNDHALVIDNGESQPKGLVESTIPLRVRRDGQAAAVDLELEEAPDAFRPRVPLVDVRLGRRPADALQVVGSGVGVQIASEPSASAAHVVDDRVFFADVAADTDAWVAPAAFGAEVFWQLRSPASPERLGLKLQLPPGASASLVRPPSRPGAPFDASMSGAAIEIRHGSELLAKIAPPVAFDADDEPVDVHYELRGNEIEVIAEHRDADLEYPILVDPYVYDQYGFGDTNFQGGWGAESNKGDHFWWDTYYGAVDWGYGLHIGQHGGLYYTGEYANYSNWAPGQTSYIYGLEMQGVHHRMPDPQNLTQNLYSGLTDAGGWQSLFNQNFTFYWGHRGHCADGRATGNNWPGNPAFCDASPRPHNRATFGAWINDYGWRTSQGHMMVRDTRMYMSDPEAPSGVSVAHLPPSDWRDDASYTSNVSASDPGLGIRNLYVVRADNGAVLGSHHQGTGSCGNRYSRCAGSGTWPVTYGTSSLPEGLNRLRGRATDAVEHSADAGGTFDVRVDRSKPKLPEPQGTLYAARNRTDDHRFEGVYGDSYTLTATASDDFSGLRDIEVFMTRAGGTRESQRTRGGYSTNGTLNWTMRPDDYPDGDYTIEIVARDNLQGTAGAPDSRHLETRTFTVTIDRRGDIYRARDYTGAPAVTGNEQLTYEAARAGTAISRSDENGKFVRTRTLVPCDDDEPNGEQCAELRTRGFDDVGEETFTVYKGQSADDPNIGDAAFLAMTARLRSEDAVERGSLTSAIAPWQRRPPAAGSEYELYRYEDTDTVSDEGASTEGTSDGGQGSETVVTRLWIDRTTRMPLKQIASSPSGAVLEEQYWIYDRQRLEPAEVTADFFRVERPANPAIDENVEHRGNDAVGEQQDRQTRERMQPYYLGERPTLPNGTPFCLADRSVIRIDESRGDDPPDLLGDGAGDQQDPLGPMTILNAAYNQVGVDGSCLPGQGDLDNPRLTVEVTGLNSAMGQNWRAEYQIEATAIQTNPLHEEFDRAGVVPVLLGLQPATAYVATTAGDESGALIESGSNSILIRGPFRKTDVPAIVQMLEVK